MLTTRSPINKARAERSELLKAGILVIEVGYMDLSLKSLEQAVSIRRQIDTLQRSLASIFASAPSGEKNRRRRRGMSAAARARLSAAMKARWAKRKGSRKTARRKGGLTPAGRRKLSQLMKARWAARRKVKRKK